MGSQCKNSEYQIKGMVRRSLKIAYNRALNSEDSTGVDRCSYFLCKCNIVNNEIEFEISFIPFKSSYKTKL